MREWSNGYPGCPGVVERLSQMSGSSRGPSRMSWSGWRPSRMYRSGREAYLMYRSGRKTIPNVWEWSGETPGSLGVV